MSIIYVDDRIELLPAQKAFNDYRRMARAGIVPTREILWRAGARGGKTYGISYSAFEDAIGLSGGGDYVVAAPTWQKCKEVVKPAFMKWAQPYCTSSQDRFAWLKNGIRVIFMGMHNPSAIDGLTIRGGWGDEIKDWKRLAFQKACERTLTTGGLWQFSTTPAGFNWIYDEFEGKNKGKPGRRFTLHSTTYDGYVDKDAVDDLAATMDERMYKQQILGEYVQFAGQVHYNWDRQHNLTRNAIIGGKSWPVEYDPLRGPVALFMDFNVEPMAGGFGQAVVIGEELFIFIFDEIFLHDSNTQEFMDIAEQRMRKWGIPKEQIIVYPDPAGRYRSTTGMSNYHIIQKINGYRLKARPNHPAVVDRINACNRLICDKNGLRHVYANPRCENFNASMEQNRYKEGTNSVDKTTGYDHLSDGWGYWIEYEFPVNYLTPGELTRARRGKSKLLYNP